MGDVLGTKKSFVFEPEQLASGLPYHMTIKGEDFADLPDEFRHKWNVQIQTKDKYGNGTTLFYKRQS